MGLPGSPEMASGPARCRQKTSPGFSQGNSLSIEALVLKSVFAAMLVVSLSRAMADTQVLHTVDAVEANVDFRSFGEERYLFSLSGQKETTLDRSQLVRWGAWTGVRGEQSVWLSDGSWVCGEIQVDQDEITVASDWLQVPGIPLKSVRGIILSPPTTISRWLDIEKQMLATEGQRDVLWLAGGRKLSGIVRWPKELSNSSQQTVEIDTAGQVVALPLATIQAIVFSPALLGPLPSAPNSARIGLTDGSLLFCKHITLSNNRLLATLGCSLVLSSLDDAQIFADSVNFLEETPTGTQFLSRLAPTSYRHIPDSTLNWELGRDLDVLGNPLHTRDGIFSRGLACHSSSQVAYRWDGSAASLLTEATFAGFSPQAAANVGSVNCQVLLARNGALETVREFKMHRPAKANEDATQLIKVDITNAKLVIFVIDKADYGQNGDQILWLDARISKASP